MYEQATDPAPEGPPTGVDERGFDWGEPNARPFVRGNERQCKFAWYRLQGWDQSKSARFAGYIGNPQALATQGNRCARAAAVQSLMAAAQAARGVQLDEAADPAEVLKRLSAEMRKASVKPAEMAQLANAYRALNDQVGERRKAEQMGKNPDVFLAELHQEWGDGGIPVIIQIAKEMGIDGWTPKRTADPNRVANGADHEGANLGETGEGDEAGETDSGIYHASAEQEGISE